MYYDLDAIGVQDAFQANSDDEGRDVAAQLLSEIAAGKIPYGDKALSWEGATEVHLRTFPGDEMGLSLRDIVPH